MCAKKLAAQPSLCGIAQSERRHSQSLLSPYLNRKILKFSDIGYKTPWNHPIIIFISQISGHILLFYVIRFITYDDTASPDRTSLQVAYSSEKANRSDLSRNTLSCLKARLSISASSSNMSFRNGNAMVQEETQMNRTLYIALITDFIQPFLTI